MAAARHRAEKVKCKFSILNSLRRNWKVLGFFPVLTGSFPPFCHVKVRARATSANRVMITSALPTGQRDQMGVVGKLDAYTQQ